MPLPIVGGVVQRLGRVSGPQLFQTDMVGVRMIWPIEWATGCVASNDGVTW